MQAIYGYVFTGTYLRFLQEVEIFPIQTDRVFGDSAILHKFHFASEGGEDHFLHIYEVHDEEQFLINCARKEFCIGFEKIEDDYKINKALNHQAQYISKGPLNLHDKLNADLKLYFQIRKKGSPCAWVLRTNSKQDHLKNLINVLENSKNIQEIRIEDGPAWLLSLGPDCFDIIIKNQS